MLKNVCNIYAKVTRAKTTHNKQWDKSNPSQNSTGRRKPNINKIDRHVNFTIPCPKAQIQQPKAIRDGPSPLKDDEKHLYSMNPLLMSFSCLQPVRYFQVLAAWPKLVFILTKFMENPGCHWITRDSFYVSTLWRGDMNTNQCLVFLVYIYHLHWVVLWNQASDSIKGILYTSLINRLFYGKLCSISQSW